MHGVLSVSLSANFFNHTLRPLDNPGTKKATVCSRCHSSTVLLCLYFRFILPPQKNPLGTIGTIGKEYRSDWNKRFLFFIWEEGITLQEIWGTVTKETDYPCNKICVHCLSRSGVRASGVSLSCSFIVSRIDLLVSPICTLPHSNGIL